MCTGVRFTDGKGNMYFGRNLDWSCSYGERVVITPRGYKPKSPFGAVPQVGMAIIGMGIVEDDTPLYFDCGNEKGLAVAGLNFPGYAVYADAPREGATNVAAFEFPLWVVANHTTVDEVEAELANVTIVDEPVSPKFPSSMLHWIIGDSTRSIVVEQAEAGLQVFHDDVDVLTNQPGFAWHTENLRNYINLTSDVPGPLSWCTQELSAFGSGAGMRGLPGDYYSPSRFVREAYLNANYPTQEGEKANVSKIFHILGGVSMIDGAAKMTNGEFETTIFTGAFSSATCTYYWSTYDDPAIRSVALFDHDVDADVLIEE